MPKKTITKKVLIVIFCTAVSFLAASCRHDPVSGGKAPAFDRERSRFGAPVETGRVESGEIKESSGITSSKCQPDVLWTHNDSGDGAFIYAIDGKGRDLGRWKVENAENVDWEDIASAKDDSGSCFLYIGDIGNGRKNPRGEHRIYKVEEPRVEAAMRGTKSKDPATTARAEVLTFSYPDERQDAETLMVHPITGNLYVVTKRRDTSAKIYRIRPAFGDGPITAERIADIEVPAIPNGFLTGGDISPDGRAVVLCDYFAAYELRLPTDSAAFDEIWKQEPVTVEIGRRNQGEAIGYSADGRSLFATSEGRYQHLIEVRIRE